LKVFE